MYMDHRELSDPLVQTLLKRFNTYAERSFSGNGFHIYGYCSLPRLPVQDGKLDRRYYTKNPQNGIELYIGGLTNRFAVYTGDAIQDVPLADCTEAMPDGCSRACCPWGRNTEPPSCPGSPTGEPPRRSGHSG